MNRYIVTLARNVLQITEVEVTAATLEEAMDIAPSRAGERDWNNTEEGKAWAKSARWIADEAGT